MAIRITLVSRSWLCHERSGVTLATAEHVRMLARSGHEVSIVGADAAVLEEQLPVVSRTHVPARGSGALYAPARIDLHSLASALESTAPDLLIAEGWQTALTDSAVGLGPTLGIPTLMISHGSSVHPFGSGLSDRLRALGWTHYRRRLLPRRISRLSALTTLDASTASPRFYDRDMARTLGVPVLPLVNAPAHWSAARVPREERKWQLLVVGYFSPIKNQIAALELTAGLAASLQVLFVGKRQGAYYLHCRKRASELGLDNRVSFVEDHECDLAQEMSRSLLILAPSHTEALPLTLLEAMACGTPFVGTPVGAVPSLCGGLLARDVSGLRAAVQSLVDDAVRWEACSQAGRRQHADCFSTRHVEAQLRIAVETACREGIRTGGTQTPARHKAPLVL